MIDFDLQKIGGGAVVEGFSVQLKKVLKNIHDPNTAATKKRTITIAIGITPNEERNLCDVSVSCVSKIADDEPFTTKMLTGEEKGRVIAEEFNPKQQTLFEVDHSTGEIINLK